MKNLPNDLWSSKEEAVEFVKMTQTSGVLPVSLDAIGEYFQT